MIQINNWIEIYIQNVLEYKFDSFHFDESYKDRGKLSRYKHTFFSFH